MAPDPVAIDLLKYITNHGEAYKNGEQGSREALVQACNALYSELMLPAESALLTQWAQPTHSAVLRLGMDIQLFDALSSDDGSPKTSAVIAERTNPKAEHSLVARMLRHLTAMNTVIEVAQDTYAPTPFARAMTQENFRDTVGFIQDDFQIANLKAPGFFKEKKYQAPKSSVDAPFQYVYDCKGTHLFEYFGQRAPMMGKRFAGMMALWSKDRPKWFDQGYYSVRDRLIDGADPGEPFLVDVGGGSGHDLVQLKEAFGDQIKGDLVLQDRPEIVAIAEKEVHAEIKKMNHDFLTEQPVKGARAYYLHSIIQDWEDETNQQILRALIPAMKRGYSKILINDFVMPDQGAHWMQTSLDWELMVSLGARHRTEAEMRKMIEGANLKVVEIFKHPQSVDSLIEVELAE
ncbi:hypothetical protein LTR97_004534 [Elasticomyces elasticus]|uniref:O-methyltransferase domain-containing protein n=1 Tax=Elasticomyces elasticus TaxID=574655 RepID=A0AAN7VSR0_9PEZI|nr:hypothetical protein LTR97_004534 [Elasticomyces elasticus]